GSESPSPSASPDSEQQQDRSSIAPSSNSDQAIASDLSVLKDRIRITDILMLLATIVIAGATVWNVIYVRGQLQEMRAGAAQTDSAIRHIAELAGQTKRQADELHNQFAQLKREADAATGELAEMKNQTALLGQGNETSKESYVAGQ